ncbi:MAG: hypothetical protein GY861_00415 [bacterium]|nr:hypothetical protein [bacterium]
MKLLLISIMMLSLCYGCSSKEQEQKQKLPSIIWTDGKEAYLLEALDEGDLYRQASAACAKGYAILHKGSTIERKGYLPLIVRCK